MRHAVWLLALVASVSFAADFTFRDMVLLTDLDPESGNGMLGRAVAVNDDFVFMGAPEKNGLDGAAYLFRIDTARNLILVTELLPQDPSPFRFGGRIVTDGDLAAVGYDTDNLIEIYRRSGSTWSLSALVEPPDLAGVSFQDFGAVFDLEGDLLVVGAPQADIDGVGNAGMALIFRRNLGGTDNWGLEETLTEDVLVQGNRFGQTVAVGTDVAVVMVDDDVDVAARVYRRSAGNWQFVKRLQPVGSVSGDAFGTSAAIEGDSIVVGAIRGNNAVQPSNAGSVHVFEHNEGGANNFGQVAELTPSLPEFIDRFGEALRLRQGVLTVGAPGSNQAFVFARGGSGWEEIAVVAPPSSLTFNNADFGKSVDYMDGSLVVGAARWDDTSSSDRRGAVFLFEDPAIVSCGVLDGIFCDSFEGDDP